MMTTQSCGLRTAWGAHSRAVKLSTLPAAFLFALSQAWGGEAVAPKVTALPEVAPTPNVDVKKAPTLEDVLVQRMPESERPLFDLLNQAIHDKTREYLAGRKPVHLTVRETVVQALERNLDIDVAGHEDELRRAALNEARAAFLPVFDASVFSDFDATYNRKRRALIFKKTIPPRPRVDIPAPSEIAAIIFMPFSAPKSVPGFEFASKRGSNGPQRPRRYSVSVSQLLPWGASYNLGVTTTYKRTFKRHDKSYDAPWVSSLNAELVVPFPFTKDFGDLASQDVAIDLAHYETQRAYWDLRATINSSLAVADLTYWELVRALKVVEVTTANRKALEVLSQKTDELLKLGKITRFQSEQVLGELARVKELEEQTWNNFIVLNDTLIELLDLDSNSLIVPICYSKHLGEHLDVKAAEALATAVENRPELAASKIGIEASKLLVRFQKHQLRPNLTTRHSISLTQTNNEIGFHTVDKSLNNIFTPDSEALSFAIEYSYPLFNRALRSQYRQAVVRNEEQKLVLRISENTVAQDVNDALASMDSANGRGVAAQLGADNARKAYASALALRDADRMTVFELIAQSQASLLADSALISAQVDLKRAETQYLFAIGLLADLYPQMTSANEFDTYRLNQLQSADVMHFFNKHKKGEK